MYNQMQYLMTPVQVMRKCFTLTVHSPCTHMLTHVCLFSPVPFRNHSPSPLVANLLISLCLSLLTISSSTSPSPRMSRDRPVSGSTTRRMVLCFRSYSSLLIGTRDFPFALAPMLLHRTATPCFTRTPTGLLLIRLFSSQVAFIGGYRAFTIL